MTIDNFNINVVVEHGYVHYKIIDTNNGREIHCDLNEILNTIKELQTENTTR